ncbi:hypothetical protein CEE37_05060 [candidate division LCP-89 bacterium B3_LCP]|uniref:Outer membrane protein beta-barrel domain-containing protein n=1 Tax=candidate division LCP-89 bacterium B3_LCP TaxID=2012998 RepID=A0A532V218_UNCL8|nr:MAG: hypothetical protein CEE37_05060 [candidate division LCP-89 bacterium B3_LCP]
MNLRKALLVCLVIGIALSMQVAQAQTDIGFKKAGVKVGYVMPGGIDNTLGFGAMVDLGTITKDFHLDAFFDYWSKSYGEGVYDWSWSMMSFGALVKYYFPLNSSNLLPYSGAGLGLNMWSSKWDYTGPTGLGYPTTYDASGSNIALHVVGGIEMPLSPKLDGLAEFKYSTGDADYVGIFVGVLYRFGE